jgi:hypothetical protein
LRKPSKKKRVKKKAAARTAAAPPGPLAPSAEEEFSNSEHGVLKAETNRGAPGLLDRTAQVMADGAEHASAGQQQQQGRPATSVSSASPAFAAPGMVLRALRARRQSTVVLSASLLALCLPGAGADSVALGLPRPRSALGLSSAARAPAGWAASSITPPGVTLV